MCGYARADHTLIVRCWPAGRSCDYAAPEKARLIATFLLNERENGGDKVDVFFCMSAQDIDAATRILPASIRHLAYRGL